MDERTFGEGGSQIKFTQFSDGEIEISSGRRKVLLLRARKGNDNYERLFNRAVNAYFEFSQSGSKAHATFAEDPSSRAAWSISRPTELFSGSAIPSIRSSKPLEPQPQSLDRESVETTLRECDAVAVLQITEEGWFGASAFLFAAESSESIERMDMDLKRLAVQYVQTAGWVDVARAS